MKKSFIITLLISIVIIFTMLSCEQPNNTIPVQEYSTPTIKGTVSIPEGKNVNPGDIYVKVIDSNDKTVTVQKVNPDKTFVVQGLSSDMLYSILFTSVEPDFANRDISRDPVKSNGVGGWIHAIQPAIKEGNNVGNVKMKPLGTIRGKALIDGKAEHYDTTVYIPGTSYIAMTSADGTFAIYNVPEGTYTLRYTHDGYMPIMNEGVILTCPEDVENPEITTRDVKLISSEGTVEGVAKLGDANDSSVVSVRLENEDKSIVYSSTSSKEGNFVINNVTPSKYRIIASASGYISQYSQYFTVAPATLTKVQENLVLYGNIGTVTGTVHLSDSDDKSGIAILISDINSDNSYTVMSDENGSFQKIVKPGSYKVSASYPGYTTITQEIVVAENTSTSVSFTALLPDSGTITGYSNSAEEQVTVIAQDGTPVATILSGLDKSYRFEKIPTGTYSVKFSKTGFASYTANDVKVAPAGTVTVNGEALKSAYGTISGTSASAEESVSLLKGGTVMDTVKTTSDRSYTFTGLEPGKYSVRFSKSGYSSYDSEEVTVSEGSRLTVNGNALVSLYGSVSGKSAGAGETVYLVSNGIPITSATTLEKREYSFSDVNPGEYTVRFSKSGYSDYESGKITVAAGGSYVVDGQTLVSLYGSVYGTSNSEGETVSLMQGSAAVQTVTTGATKKYRFDNIQPGTYTVRFEKHACVAYTSSEVSVIAGSSVEVNGNRLSSSYGTVTGRSASAGEQISLVGSDGIPVKNTESGSDGTYRFEEVLPGTYSVKFSKTGFASYTANDVKVAPAGTVTVNGEALKSAYGTISGTSASAEESVSLLKGGTVMDTVKTTSDRSYTFTGLEPGKYSVRFSKDGYSSYDSEEVNVGEGSKLIVNGKALMSLYGSVSGKSAGAGETVYLVRNGVQIKTATTLENKEYSFSDVMPGEYTVRFSKSGYSDYESGKITVAAGGSYVVDGQTLVSLYGSVYGTSSSEGETVSLIQGSAAVQTVKTGATKAYRFDNIQPGTYTVRFEKHACVAYTSSEVSVIAGSSVEVNGNRLSSSYGTVTGRSASAGEQISLVGSDGVPVQNTESGSDGTYRFEEVLPGTYSVKFSKTGFASYTANDVKVAPAGTVTVNGEALKRAYGTISGTSAGEGESVSLIRDGVVIETVTVDSSKQYIFTGIAPGTYSVKFSREGYTPYESDMTSVAAGSEITINGTTLISIYGSVKGLSSSSGETVSLIKNGTVLKTVVTSQDRSYKFELVSPGTYSVRFSREGYTPYDSEGVTVSAGKEAIVNGNTLVSKYGTISGVSASVGETVYLVRNGVQIQTKTTLENKEYSFSDVRPGEYTVRFSKSGYSDYESGKITVAAGGSYVVDGQTLVSLYGSVYGTSNSEGETVSLMQGSAAVQTVTIGATKKYRFDNIQPGTYTVRFEKHACVAYTSSEVNVIAGSSVEVNGNRLPSSYGTVTGRSASAGEQISLVGSDGVPVQNTESGSDGTYRFEEVLPGTYSVKFSKTGFASYTANDVKVAPAGTVTVNGEALKRAYGTISGTSAGEGESVSLIRGGVVIETVTVNASKQYSFTYIEPGNYSVRFSREGYTPYESDMTSVAAGSEITINGTTLISIYGSVKGLSSSSGETVSLIKNGTVLKTVVTSQDRSYRFELVEPGTYNVRFSKEGYTPYESEGVTVSAGKEAIVNGNTLISEFGTIKGVSSSSGETVYLVRNGVQIQTKTTLENREYIFSGITPGEYSVRFTKSGYKVYESDVFTVVAGESYVVDGQKLEGLYGAVAGHVLLSDTNDYSGVVITLTNSSVMTQSLSEISASDGSFRFDNITTPGTYLLTYSKDGYIKNQNKSVQVVTGSVAVAQTVTLKSTTSTVKGIVTLDGYTSHENISILLKNNNNQYTATTDQKGNYLINRVLPGTYSLIASKDGFITSQSVNIVIEPSVDKQLEPLSLAVAVKSITGSVELELANDYSGVLVTATNLRDNKLVYSAISNSNGAFTLAGMKSGEYSIVLSCGGYNSITLPTVNVSGTTVFNLDKQYMEISRGRIAGLVRLEGYSDHSGVKVSMLGTDYVTTTASDGSFEFNVPAANYPGGLRFEKEDMETTAYTETIPVIVNSTYALKRDISMSAVNVPVVKGIVKVGGTSDWSGVTVRLVERPEYTFVTGSDGTWCFEHVPLGKYTIEYTRENAKKITSVLNVSAGPIVNASNLTIIPDSASIEGHISLDSVSDYSGITVKVSTSSVSKEYTATTDSAGYFYIGNLLSSGTHTVTIEKAGWNSKSIVLSNLEPLSLTDISATSSIVLTDTRAPVINSVSINGGANSTGSRKVNITVNTFEEGSGTALVQYTWTNGFEASSWLNYASSFDVTIPDEVNGTKTLKLRVKDNAGNVSSAVSDSIDLVGQIQSIGGTLSVDDLHWVKENNPYVVTSDLVIPEGRTLVIDPGVDVLFDGNYWVNHFFCGVNGQLER